MARAAWKQHWCVVKELTPGGQGNTFLVQRAASQEDEAKYVLKALRNQSSPERRERLFQEVNNLKLLEHVAISRFVESNAEQYKTDEDLYLVTEYVPGPDLHAYVKEVKQVSVKDAATCVLRILDALQYCHKKNVLHRDVKPANVIVRDGKPDQPVLLDFGLSFNAETRSPDFMTETGQHIGNRFIMLPEYHTTDADKRTDVSDIAQCVGLLFFMLTGQAPESLVDQQGCKPHDRARPKQLLSPLPEYRQLCRIFDVGFSVDLPRRWQTIQALREEVQKLGQVGAPQKAEFKSRLADLLAAASRNPDLSQRARAKELVKIMSSGFHKVLQEFNQSLTGFVSASVTSGRSQDERGEHESTLFVSVTHYPERRGEAKFGTIIQNTELVIYCIIKDGNSRELSRMGLFDPDAERIIRSATEEFFASVGQEFLPVS